MTVYRQALLIRGLSWASSQYPTLFVDGELAKATLPAGYGPLNDANLQVVARLVPNSISGATWTCSIREPVGVGSTPSVKLIEDSTGSFARIFAHDPGHKYTYFWQVTTTNELDATSTTIKMQGDDSPANNSVVWLDKEAIRLGTLSASTGTSRTFTGCTRGACGSKAREHHLDPDTYSPGDTGVNDCLLLSTRMLWDDVQYEASLYVFAMSEDDPANVAEVVWCWNGYVEGRPTFDAGKRQWELQIAHVTKRIAEHSIGGTKDMLELQSAIKVVSHIPNPQTPGAYLPSRVEIHLTRYQREKLFRRAMHQPLQDGGEDTAETQAAVAFGLPDVAYQIVGEVGGHTFVWQVDLATYPSDRVPAVLVAWSPGASTKDKWRNHDATTQFPRRHNYLNDGFYYTPFANAIRTDNNETPPKVRLRTVINKNFPNALAAWLLSGYGNGSNHATHDVLIGGRGLYLDPDWIDIGSTPPNPLLTDLGTTALEEIASLLAGGEYTYVIEPETKLGDWLKNELYLHTSLLGYDPVTGKISIRKWLRPLDVTAITPLVGSANIVETSERLPALKALFLERGYDPVTLQPKVRNPIRLRGSTAKDVSEAITIRVWKPGAEFTDNELATGPLADLEMALFGTTMGTPAQYDISLPLTTAVMFADQLTWTDSNVPTPAGLGVSSVPILATGQDFRFDQGKQVVRAIVDVVNDAIVNNTDNNVVGNVAPALEITGIVSVDSVTGEYTVEVEPVGQNTAFDITLDHFGFWGAAAGNSEPVEVLNVKHHNPVATNERPGPLNLSGVLSNVTHTTAKRNRMTFTVDSAWARGGFTLNDIVKRGSYILPQTTVPAASNPTGVDIGTSASTTRYGDFIRATAPSQPNSTRYRI